jgi:hypothetical protein
MEEQELRRRFRSAVEEIGSEACATEQAQTLRDLVVRTLDHGIRALAGENHARAANDQ